jgi:two-component system, OmpR family, response regulator VicR
MSSDNVPAPSSVEMTSSKSMLPVLIVDDDLAVVNLLRTVLQEEGFPVETANNAGAALFFVLERTPVALVVTDFMMPGLSGLEFADVLRHDPRTATVPVILMSAFPPPDGETPLRP